MRRFRFLLSVLTVFILAGCGSDSSSAVEPSIETRRTEKPAGSFAVVELFTSQGCSSCPPADKNLTAILERSKQDGSRVYCLSFHVDYWNYLGWNDPYSSESNSKRQRDYAKAMRTGRVYTPQMVVNGARDVVGSRGGDVRTAVAAALEDEPTARVSIDAKVTRAGIRVRYAVDGTTEGCVLNVAVVQTSRKNDVPRGENAGRTLAHSNVVQTFETIDLDKQKGTTTLDVPDGTRIGELRVVGYVQQRDGMQILGAADAAIQKASAD